MDSKSNFFAWSELLVDVRGLRLGDCLQLLQAALEADLAAEEERSALLNACAGFLQALQGSLPATPRALTEPYRWLILGAKADALPGDPEDNADAPSLTDLGLLSAAGLYVDEECALAGVSPRITKLCRSRLAEGVYVYGPNHHLVEDFPAEIEEEAADILCYLALARRQADAKGLELPPEAGVPIRLLAAAVLRLAPRLRLRAPVAGLSAPAEAF